MANPKGNVETLQHFEGKWNSGKTKTVRVPVVLASQVLAYAHKLDSGESLVTSESIKDHGGGEIDRETLSQVIQLLKDGLAFPSNNATKTKHKIREALALLESAIATPV